MNNHQIRLQAIRDSRQLDHKVTTVKDIKQKTKESFEKCFQITSEFDSYIDSMFLKMNQQKSENPTLIIPKGFREFIGSKLFKEFLKKIYEYMDTLVKFQNKFIRLDQFARQTNSPSLMQHQASLLRQKCKQISYVYMGILLSHGECKFIFRDQYFFETMIYFLGQILKQNFEEDEYIMVDEELNRIFRTDTFNLIKRRHEQDKVLGRYPDLKQARYDSGHTGVNKLIKRISIHKKFRYSVQVRPPKQLKSSLEKPVNISETTFKSINSRSPLIASFYPSQKQKLFNFSKSYRNQESFIKSARVSSSFSFKK